MHFHELLFKARLRMEKLSRKFLSSETRRTSSDQMEWKKLFLLFKCNWNLIKKFTAANENLFSPFSFAGGGVK